jgi:phosphatidylserine/phosphatidylglycerophosphate/cardiolipin synthase-like enzyme
MLNKFIALLLAFFPVTGTAYALDIRVCFTPGEDCTGVIVDQLAAAKREVLVQAYSFTNPDIVKALVAAKKRGVDVRAILDKSNFCRAEKAGCENKGQIAADTLVIAKVPVTVDREHAIAHNKIMVIDRERVITGSFNFSRAAQEKNAENLLVITDAAQAQRYTRNWQFHAEHSERYAGR